MKIPCFHSLIHLIWSPVLLLFTSSSAWPPPALLVLLLLWSLRIIRSGVFLLSSPLSIPAWRWCNLSPWLGFCCWIRVHRQVSSPRRRLSLEGRVWVGDKTNTSLLNLRTTGHNWICPAAVRCSRYESLSRGSIRSLRSEAGGGGWISSVLFSFHERCNTQDADGAINVLSIQDKQISLLDSSQTEVRRRGWFCSCALQTVRCVTHYLELFLKE